MLAHSLKAQRPSKGRQGSGAGRRGPGLLQYFAPSPALGGLGGSPAPQAAQRLRSALPPACRQTFLFNSSRT